MEVVVFTRLGNQTGEGCREVFPDTGDLLVPSSNAGPGSMGLETLFDSLSFLSQDLLEHLLYTGLCCWGVAATVGERTHMDGRTFGPTRTMVDTSEDDKLGSGEGPPEMTGMGTKWGGFPIGGSMPSQ